MEDKKDTNFSCGHCTCGACGYDGGMMGMHGKHNMRHKLFWILIFIIVFCLGSAWGELKGEVRSLHHYGSHGERFMGPGPMMGDGNFEYKLFKNTAPTTNTPAIPATPGQ